MTEFPTETAAALVKPYGYQVRRVPRGFFINEGGDDLMFVRDDGQVSVYAHDGNAFYAAEVLADAIAKTFASPPPVSNAHVEPGATLFTDLEVIWNKSDAELIAEGIAEYGSPEAFHAAMNVLRDKMLAALDRAAIAKAEEGK